MQQQLTELSMPMSSSPSIQVDVVAISTESTRILSSIYFIDFKVFQNDCLTHNLLQVNIQEILEQ